MASRRRRSTLSLLLVAALLALVAVAASPILPDPPPRSDALVRMVVYASVAPGGVPRAADYRYFRFSGCENEAHRGFVCSAAPWCGC